MDDWYSSERCQHPSDRGFRPFSIVFQHSEQKGCRNSTPRGAIWLSVIWRPKEYCFGTPYTEGCCFHTKKVENLWKKGAICGNSTPGALFRYPYFCECGSQVSLVVNRCGKWRSLHQKLIRVWTINCLEIRPAKTLISPECQCFLLRWQNMCHTSIFHRSFMLFWHG